MHVFSNNSQVVFFLVSERKHETYIVTKQYLKALKYKNI